MANANYVVPNEVNRTSDLTGQNAKFTPELWRKGVEVSEYENDFFRDWEGRSPESPIMSITDLSKGAGQKIHFRTMADLYGDGVIGDEIIGDNTEEWRVGGFDLEVDYLRHATSHNLRTEDQTALAAEIKSGIPMALGRWLGRKKTERLLMMFLHLGGPDNTIYINDKGSREALKSADTPVWGTLTTTGQKLKTLGAKPANVARKGENKIWRYIWLGLGESLTSLKNSSDYKTFLQSAGVRGGANCIFRGGYEDVDGHIIKEFNPIDHDGWGPVGSPLNPKAFLGTAITPGTTEFDITGGGSAAAAALDRKYFEFFSNYPYRFTPGQTLSAGTTERFVMIYNVSGADAGKWGFYRYIYNNGNKLGVDDTSGNGTTGAGGRLAASVAGNASTKIGNVSWNATVNTDTHPSGSIILECNSYGVPIGRSIMLGAMAAVRGYGRFTNLRTEEKMDGDFIKKTFITSIFGQSPVKRVDGKCPNFVVVEHALDYAGLKLPTVA